MAWGHDSSMTADSSSVTQDGLTLAALAVLSEPGLGWQWTFIPRQVLLPPALPHGANLWAQTGH